MLNKNRARLAVRRRRWRCGAAVPGLGGRRRSTVMPNEGSASTPLLWAKQASRGWPACAGHDEEVGWPACAGHDGGYGWPPMTVGPDWITAPCAGRDGDVPRPA